MKTTRLILFCIFLLQHPFSFAQSKLSDSPRSSSEVHIYKIGKDDLRKIHIKEEGVVLYDSGKFKLARRRKLNFDEIKQQAQEYFNDKFIYANSFLRSANHDYNDKEYKMCSFHLHQACENYIYAIRLVFTLENPKQHNLSKLLNSVKKYSNEFIKVFPQDTPEEKRLFELIKAAYVNGRYDPDFVVTKEDIDALIPKVELLRDITKSICEEKIGEYGEVLNN